MNKFDELVKECQTMAFEEGWKKVWTKLFSLEKILVAIRKPVEEKDQEQPQMFIGSMNEAPCVFGFTDQEHFDEFQKDVIKNGNDREVEYRELTIEAFLNFTQHMAFQNIPFILMNFGNACDCGFHAPTKDVVSMYNGYMKGDFLQEQRIEPGMMISVAIPESINEMRKSIEQVKGNYKNVLNYVSPILVKVENRIDLTLVMGFKAGLPVTIKKSVMQNIHKELAVSPLFQTQLHFTEEQNLIPPQIKNVVQVNF